MNCRKDRRERQDLHTCPKYCSPLQSREDSTIARQKQHSLGGGSYLHEYGVFRAQMVWDIHLFSATTLNTCTPATGGALSVIKSMHGPSHIMHLCNLNLSHWNDQRQTVFEIPPAHHSNTKPRPGILSGGREPLLSSVDGDCSLRPGRLAYSTVFQNKTKHSLRISDGKISKESPLLNYCKVR